MHSQFYNNMILESYELYIDRGPLSNMDMCFFVNRPVSPYKLKYIVMLRISRYGYFDHSERSLRYIVSSCKRIRAHAGPLAGTSAPRSSVLLFVDIISAFLVNIFISQSLHFVT